MLKALWWHATCDCIETRMFSLDVLHGQHVIAYPFVTLNFFPNYKKIITWLIFPGIIIMPCILWIRIRHYCKHYHFNDEFPQWTWKITRIRNATAYWPLSCFAWDFLCMITNRLLIYSGFHQPAKLYKLKHLSKVEVLANDPSGCTFTLVSYISWITKDQCRIISIDSVPVTSSSSFTSVQVILLNASAGVW